jgi:hypothetical protein
MHDASLSCVDHARGRSRRSAVPPTNRRSAFPGDREVRCTCLWMTATGLTDVTHTALHRCAISLCLSIPNHPPSPPMPMNELPISQHWARLTPEKGSSTGAGPKTRTNSHGPPVTTASTLKNSVAFIGQSASAQQVNKLQASPRATERSNGAAQRLTGGHRHSA